MTARGDQGFTLLEVLVALAILGLAVVAAIQGFAQGLRLLKVSGDHQQAMLIADLKAREVVTLEETHDQGTEGDYQWERTTRLLDTPDLTPPVGTPPRYRVWEIAVRVRWDERRQVEVTTLRTAAATNLEDATSRGAAPAPGAPTTGPGSQPGTTSSRGTTTGSGSLSPGRSTTSPGSPVPGRSTIPSSRSSSGSSTATSGMR